LDFGSGRPRRGLPNTRARPLRRALTGSATLMRGKSPTCRYVAHLTNRSLTVAGRRPDEEEGSEAGKSKTCRASEWQSHCSAAKFDGSPRGFKYVIAFSDSVGKFASPVFSAIVSEPRAVATGSRDTLENVSCSTQLRLDPVATARGSDTTTQKTTALHREMLFPDKLLNAGIKPVHLLHSYERHVAHS